MDTLGKTGKYQEMLLVISSLFDDIPPPQNEQGKHETEASSETNIPQQIAMQV